METANSKYLKMTQTPIPRLVCTLAIPTIISMMISSIYNMADTFFVGQIGTSASAAVGISFSLMAIVQAIGFTLGMGSGNYISRLLGQQNSKDASYVASTAFFTALGVGALFTIIGLIFLDPLVRVLGATPTILPYAKDYVFYILIGIPFITASFVLNNILRFQGSAFYAMFGITFGGLLNIGLDPLFIFGFNMGTGGAALATIISQFISFCLLLFASGRGGNIKINLKDFKFDWSIYKEILSGGLPSFYRQGLASIATICLNLIAGPFGDAAIAAMSIVTRVFQFAVSILLGFGQGFQPVCGFNYGAKLYGRVIEAFWFCIKTAVIVLSIMAVIGFIFAPQIISIFRKGDPAVTSIGTMAFRLQCITFPLSSWIIINNMLLQTIGESKKASILALARQGLFFLPPILILPKLFGILGIELSQPIADLLTFIIAIPMGTRVLNKLKILQKEDQEPAGEKVII
ncbi:MAG TPA: MATE family efflux transporter [Ruminiclostridium sp.]|nr:MATE family efflux transporter [Ruminiclostridium sp.]